ncbi:MAG TPA: hypothetical protein VD713_06145 [Sphingomonadales bacterium]|nr:hypothetical protein [Sphingomonadales bacterium]
MGLSYRVLGNQEAGVLSAAWTLDASFCEKKKNIYDETDCEMYREFSLDQMMDLAFRGNAAAIAFLLDYHAAFPDSHRDRWALYQVFLLAGFVNYPVNENVRGEASRGLAPFERLLIEAWTKDNPALPITTYFPRTDP